MGKWRELEARTGRRRRAARPGDVRRRGAAEERGGGAELLGVAVAAGGDGGAGLRARRPPPWCRARSAAASSRDATRSVAIRPGRSMFTVTPSSGDLGGEGLEVAGQRGAAGVGQRQVGQRRGHAARPDGEHPAPAARSASPAGSARAGAAAGAAASDGRVESVVATVAGGAGLRARAVEHQDVDGPRPPRSVRRRPRASGVVRPVGQTVEVRPATPDRRRWQLGGDLLGPVAAAARTTTTGRPRRPGRGRSPGPGRRSTPQTTAQLPVESEVQSEAPCRSSAGGRGRDSRAAAARDGHAQRRRERAAGGRDADSTISPRRRSASLRTASAIRACCSKLISGRYGRNASRAAS